MKTTLAALICLLGTWVMSQNEYTITFDQIMETEDTTMQQTLDMMGEMSTTWYISGTKFRSESVAGMTGTTTIIYDASAEEVLMLIESPFMGNSYMSFKDTTEADDPELKVVKTKETKEIAGYKCIKYVVIDSTGLKTILYATDKIKNPFGAQFGNNVEGAVLYSEMETETMGAIMTIKMIATEVNHEPISEDKFSLEIPEGYTEMER